MMSGGSCASFCSWAGSSLNGSGSCFLLARRRLAGGGGSSGSLGLGLTWNENADGQVRVRPSHGRDSASAG